MLEEQEQIAKRIGERLKALRIAKGYSSYEKFAFENDIDRAQYGRYERGGDMRISTLVRILRALDVPIDDFFSEGFVE